MLEERKADAWRWPEQIPGTRQACVLTGITECGGEIRNGVCARHSGAIFQIALK